MGSAIGERIKARYRVIIFDKDRNKTQGVGGAEVAKDISDLVRKADTVILAIKPQDFDIILNEIKDYVKDKLIISIAAGIATRDLENRLGEIRIIRAMPNMLVRIGKGTSCLCKGRFATDEDIKFVKELFDYVGQTTILKEEMMGEATAISGSGPGYYFYWVETKPEEYKKNTAQFINKCIVELTKAAESIGFNAQQAKFLSHWTVIYSDLLLKQTGLSPAELKRRVASKGGTTEAALAVLEKGGLLVDAVRAAAERAKQLSKKE